MTPRRLTQAAVHTIVTYPTLMLHVLLLALLIVVFSVPIASEPLQLHWQPATPEEIHQHEVDRLGDALEAARLGNG